MDALAKTPQQPWKQRLMNNKSPVFKLIGHDIHLKITMSEWNRLLKLNHENPYPWAVYDDDRIHVWVPIGQSLNDIVNNTRHGK